MTLNSSGWQEVNGKMVYLIDIAANNLPTKRADIREALIGKHILVDDRPTKVIGIEMFATPEDTDHIQIGLMVEMY